MELDFWTLLCIFSICFCNPENFHSLNIFFILYFSTHFSSFLCPSISLSALSYTTVPLSGSAANSRSSTQMNSYSDSGYQEVSGYYSNLVTSRRSEGRSQSTSSAPSFSPSQAMGSRAEGQALAQVGLQKIATSGV